jgi:hypothetical protein
MQLTLSHSIGHREAPIVKEADQRRPALETVIISLGGLAVLETLVRCSGPSKPSAEPGGTSDPGSRRSRTSLDPFCGGKYHFQYL